MSGQSIINLWGQIPAGQDESGDNIVVRPHGALSRKSKLMGDGFWCPVCYQHGKYSWVEDHKYKQCNLCRTRINTMDSDEIERIMKKR